MGTGGTGWSIKKHGIPQAMAFLSEESDDQTVKFGVFSTCSDKPGPSFILTSWTEMMT